MPFVRSLSPSTLRILCATALLIIGCGIGVWDYARQEVNEFVYKDMLDESEENCIVCEDPVSPDTEPTDQTLEILKGDTFSSVLQRADIAKTEIYSIINAIKKVFNPRDLRTDHQLFVTFKPGTTKEIEKLVLQTALDTEITVQLNDDGVLEAQKIEKELVHDYRHAEGIIENSLYVDAIKQGAHPKIIHNMIQAFSYDVDFQRGFRSGDSFAVLFDYYKDPDSLSEKPGDVIFAKLKLHGQDICIYRHKHENGVVQYYNEKGEAVKKGLLMTPVDGARISSNYGHRKHPVLGYTKLHKGIDFAAPRGTPIMAAGSGKILKIGRLGSYGNYIRIRHNSTIDTAYAHMCRFAKGLKPGSSVRQGQIIGYVGCTGRATGNHLHYELIKNGKQVNPKHVKTMPATKLKDKDLQTFMANKAQIDKRLLDMTKDQTDLDSTDLNNSDLANNSQASPENVQT